MFGGAVKDILNGYLKLNACSYKSWNSIIFDNILNVEKDNC